MNLGQLFDHYSLRARLQPALNTLSPLAFGVIAWTGPSKPWMTALWTLAGSVGLTFCLAIIARNRGKAIEPTLWTLWGGSPTTQLLRHRGPTNTLVRDRWHTSLFKLTGIRLPTAEEERLNPSRADEAYEAASRTLVVKARENQKKNPLIYKENVQYGFCRNLYALRFVGIVFAIIGLAASIGAGTYFISRDQISAIPWVCAAICLLLLLAWIFVFTASWVRVPAFAYANRLFESLDMPIRSRSSKKDAKTTDS